MISKNVFIFKVDTSDYQYLVNQIIKFNYDNIITSIFKIHHLDRFILILLLFVVFVITYFILNLKKDLGKLNLYLNVVLICFLGVAVGKVLLIKDYTITLTNQPEIPNGKLIDSLLSEKPKIYYIILDSYTSSESLLKYWKYDNTPFEDSLMKMGFFIARKSKADYDFTPYCMASYLNTSLLNLDPQKPKNELFKQTTFDNTLSLIKNSNLAHRIINSGYEFLNLSLFDIGNTKGLYMVWNHKSSESFTFGLFYATIWPVLIGEFRLLFHPFTLPPIDQDLRIFKLLKDSSLNRSEVPKFIYAHIMMPHYPYKFDENGHYITSDNGMNAGKEKYLGQLRYTNKLIIETIRKILISEKIQPIIIIQGDHGYRLLKNVDLKTQRAEAHSIFSSYLFPTVLKTHLNDSIKPIQALSLLFD